MNPRRGCAVKIVTFSGIDGAGKSTQICALEAWLKQKGQRTLLLTFWDDVVMFSRFREFMSHKAFKGDQGIGSPQKPLHRRDKNVTSWPVIALRFFLYFADALNLSRKVRSLKRKSDADVVIFDRYIYDELANLPQKSWPTKVFIRCIQAFIPKPEVAYFIDADPAAAFARKPEYPLEFVRNNREAYLTLGQFLGGVTIIEPLTVEAMSMKVREAFVQERSRAKPEFSELPALP